VATLEAPLPQTQICNSGKVACVHQVADAGATSLPMWAAMGDWSRIHYLLGCLTWTLVLTSNQYRTCSVTRNEGHAWNACTVS
jgi:hypothetical protein